MSGLFSKAFRTQSFGIPAPTLTEKNLPDQAGRKIIVTGGYAGVGQELVKILYEKNATVYVAGRSEDKALKSIAAVKSQFPTSSGKIEFLLLDLADLTTIKASAEAYMSKETRLDVLINNAGVMTPPAGSKTAQGYEQQMGTNCLGHFLFTELLLPVLKATAASLPGSVRVAWAASIVVQLASPKSGVAFKDGKPEEFKSQNTNYAQSKAANLLLGSEFARRHRADGIISASFNPGNLKTELQRHMGGVQSYLVDMILHPAIFGAYTELYAGWSTDITLENSGLFIMPWGRDGNQLLREDVLDSTKSKDDGGGTAQELWEWCERETSKYK